MTTRARAQLRALLLREANFVRALLESRDEAAGLVALYPIRLHDLTHSCASWRRSTDRVLKHPLAWQGVYGE
jgi:hypothetical protein